MFINSGSISFSPNQIDEENPRIVFDYSHGQNLQTQVWNETDPLIEGNLTEMGFDVVWARGGINESILSSADALILGSVWAEREFYTSEINAISSWFNQGSRFLWVGCDNDYEGAYINENMNLVLEAVKSHVYPEPCEVVDDVCCCAEGFGYRVYAPIFSNDTFVEPIVRGVERVLMHGPTLLYGSRSSSPGVDNNPVILESEKLENIYPILYFSPYAVIARAHYPELVIHEMNQTGSFVACTIEINAGSSNQGVLMVSGASPYGDYQPMWTEEYYDTELNGYLFVRQAIEFGIQKAMSYSSEISLEFYVTIGLAIMGVLACVVAVRVLREPE